jgi:hypothetical protein
METDLLCVNFIFKPFYKLLNQLKNKQCPAKDKIRHQLMVQAQESWEQEER